MVTIIDRNQRCKGTTKLLLLSTINEESIYAQNLGLNHKNIVSEISYLRTEINYCFAADMGLETGLKIRFKKKRRINNK